MGVDQYGYIKGSTITTATASKYIAQAEALYDLFNTFGRGRVNEETWWAMYLNGALPQFIKKVVDGTYEPIPQRKVEHKEKKRKKRL